MRPAEEVIGTVGFSVMTVRPGDTCVAMGISDLPIVASSHFLNVMESASVASLVEYLEPGETTILNRVLLEILTSASIGSEIRGTARCVEVNGRELTFICDIYEGERHIATAEIKRTAVERVSFLARTAAQSLLEE